MVATVTKCYLFLVYSVLALQIPRTSRKEPLGAALLTQSKAALLTKTDLRQGS
jgi:hypothetical protein